MMKAGLETVFTIWSGVIILKMLKYEKAVCCDSTSKTIYTEAYSYMRTNVLNYTILN